MSLSILVGCCFALAPALASSPSPAPVSSPTPSLPSDPVGVYALVDRAEVDPQAKTIVLHGAFLIGVGKYGNEQLAARWGTLHLRSKPEHAEQHAKFFADLAAVANTGKVVSFGSRRDGAGYAVGSAEAPKWIQLQEHAAAYPLGDAEHYGPVMQLRTLPRDLAVKFSAERGYGDTRDVEISCTAGPDRDASVRYVFQFELADGQRFASEPVAVGEKGRVAFERPFLLGSEERVRMSVHAQREGLSSTTVLTREFTAPKDASEAASARR